MLSLDEYLNNFIEKYLFSDIRTMINLDKEQVSGRLGYPLIMTVCSGIEALGEIIRPNTVKNESRPVFCYYWENILADYNSKYKGYGDIFYENVRSGIAHRYISKGYAVISNDELAKDSHFMSLILEQVHKKGLWVDAKALADDFISSYNGLFIDLLKQPKQRRIAEDNWSRIDNEITSRNF